jgi:hypothetical protein
LPVLNWTSFVNNRINYYEIQRSVDGKNFYTIQRIENSNPDAGIVSYSFTDREAINSLIYYRIKVISTNAAVYSRINSLELAQAKTFSMLPNPALSYVQISMQAEKNEPVALAIYNVAGELLYVRNYDVRQGHNVIRVEDINRWKPGIYMVRMSTATINQWQKLIIGH